MDEFESYAPERDSEKCVIHIGILRFPDAELPYLKVGNCLSLK